MQWKARYSDGEELWETPESSTATLDISRLASFELTQDGIIRNRWTFTEPTPFGYRLRTRIPLLVDGDTETIRLIRFGDSVTYVYPDRTETVSDLSDFLPAQPTE